MCHSKLPSHHQAAVQPMSISMSLIITTRSYGCTSLLGKKAWSLPVSYPCVFILNTLDTAYECKQYITYIYIHNI